MWYFILAVAIFIISAIIVGNKNSKEYSNELAKKGMKVNEFLISGKYLHGHPNILKIIEHSYCYLFFNEMKIYELPKNKFKHVELASIPYSKITNISIEDKSTIQTRVGLKRLMVAGIFAFAMKKKEKLELLYLVVEWEDYGFKNETVFEFEGTNVKYCSLLKTSIQNAVINNKMKIYG